ncbi:hypothetical protein M3Y98_00725600 [Aphelenchoides besseyi]|nr:hypothetical protein M3Y98_00725600 [Aphelenchoides besseyi]KAI6210195.1 hypothetical protein M3Y96_00301900 [Aphelenchoides besseyi]
MKKCFVLFLFISVSCESAITGDVNTTALSTLVRSKRQSYWYLCGRYPNQYYSRYPCYAYGNSRCENGGQKLGVGCTIANQCVPYHRGTVACIRGCCCTVPGPYIPQPGRPVGPAGFCPSGQLSQIRCSAPGQCSTSQTCMSGLCCTRRQNEYTVACGGNFAIAQCSARRTCQSSYVCTAGNYCCQCPVGRSGGRCNRGRCSRGYTCHSNGYCCAQCPGNVMPYGMCVNGQCGGGRRCITGNICC